ncbi:SSI family serine proteinase inhibitor [Streptomyces sp. NPDC056361]|uniref:SSI family serine proteinase inhibitor n=1 Tax=Streptomyces sp. NPDC056361 TaxID=3345795 RepID=UPI0035D7F621
MNKIALALGAVLLAALPTGTAFPTPAPAPQPVPEAHLQLTATRTVHGIESTRFAWLDCPAPHLTPKHPSHPHHTSACTDLAVAHGDLDHLPGHTTAICSNDAAQITVTANGVYDDRAVHWQHTYDDDCHLTLATGQVFDF